MDLDGVDVSILYPALGLQLFNVPDGELLTDVFKTYNNRLAEFCQDASQSPRCHKPFGSGEGYRTSTNLYAEEIICASGAKGMATRGGRRLGSGGLVDGRKLRILRRGQSV